MHNFSINLDSVMNYRVNIMILLTKLNSRNVISCDWCLREDKWIKSLINSSFMWEKVETKLAIFSCIFPVANFNWRLEFSLIETWIILKAIWIEKLEKMTLHNYWKLPLIFQRSYQNFEILSWWGWKFSMREVKIML